MKSRQTGLLRSLFRKIDLRWKDSPTELTGTLRRRDMSMSYVTGGMLTPGNLDAMAHAVSNAPSEAAFVEIGSFCGLSSNLITFLKRHFGRTNTFFAFDPWEFASEHGEDDPTFTRFMELSWEEYENFVREAYLNRVGLFSRHDLPHAVRGRSQDLFIKWQSRDTVEDVFGRRVRLGGRIAFAFVDGDHSYEGALSDFENIDRHLEVGGFILFDDSADVSSWGCARVAKAARRLKNYRLVSKNPNYLVQKIA